VHQNDKTSEYLNLQVPAAVPATAAAFRAKIKLIFSTQEKFCYKFKFNNFQIKCYIKVSLKT
jgi:small basic protein